MKLVQNAFNRVKIFKIKTPNKNINNLINIHIIELFKIFCILLNEKLFIQN